TAGGTGTGKAPTGGIRGEQGGERLFAEELRPGLEEQGLNCHGGNFTPAAAGGQGRGRRLRGRDPGRVGGPGGAGHRSQERSSRHEHEPGMAYKAPKLGEEVIERIVAWINAGAPYDGTLKLPAEVTQGITLRHGSDHWAYQKPKRVAIPEVKNRGWVRNPIDAFVAAEQEKRGLKPLGEADRRTLLRRGLRGSSGVCCAGGGVDGIFWRSAAGC